MAWNRRSLCQQMERLKRKCGVKHPASLHGIRHRAASAAIIAGAPLSLVAAQLGHASTTTTSRYYVHLDRQIDAIRDAMRLGVPRES
jgi:integrase